MRRTKGKILLFLVIIIIFSGKVFATEFKAIEKSAEFKKWENLKEEERANTIQPTYYAITFKDSIKRSTYNNLLNLRESAQGTYYSLKDDNINIKVKNQDYTNACWAFSYTSVLETSFQKTLNTNLEYSPMHLELKSAKMFNRAIDSGGNAFLALAYSTSGNGPVLESDMPISSVYNEAEKSYVSNVENLDLNKTITGQVTEASILPTLSKTYLENGVIYSDGLQNQYTQEQVIAIRDIIKKFIKENGAISACMYTDIAIDEDGNILSEYFNPTTSAYYCNDNTKVTNHAITIIGWNDDYEITNFKSGNQPSSKGAYIVLNSYGEEFGDNGYMYISYEDFAIESTLIGLDSVVNEKSYDKIYQYDELGVNYGMFNGDANLYAANIFTRDVSNQDVDEYLNEVGVYLLSTEGVEVYLSNNGDLTNLEQLAAVQILEPGYHTIELSSPKKLTEEKFAIVIKYTNSAEGAIIPIESNLYESGLSLTSDFYSTATANMGESKWSKDGTTWDEVNDTEIDFFAKLKNTNNCIKAFTTFQEKSSTITVTGVEISEETIELNQGNSVSIQATVKPENATNKNVSWSSSDINVATVENGIVTGVSEGTATITVTTEDGNKTDTCEVTVVAANNEEEIINVTAVKLNVNSIKINKNSTYTLVPTVEPNNATNKNVSWSSSDINVATVENGVVTGVSEGTATITVTTEDGNKTDTCEVTVLAANNEEEIINVTAVKLNVNSIEIDKNSIYTLVPTVEPNNATNKNVSWSSSDINVATVENGVVTGVSEGTATITVTTEDGNKTANCTVKVNNNSEVKLENITLNKRALELEVGDEANLVVSFNPENVSNKEVTWSSSNTQVATVDANGIITAISEGTTTITVTSKDGNKTATCELTVVKKDNSDDDIYKDNSNNNNQDKPTQQDKTDDTIAKEELPNTGLRIVLLILGIGIVFIAVISFIKYRKFIDIK